MEICVSQPYPFFNIYDAIAECIFALYQSYDPILIEKALTEKECKQDKDNTDKTRNSFLLIFIVSHQNI